jgi:hypothetical protein
MLTSRAKAHAIPQTRPEKLKKSPAPLFHAASKDARQGLRAAYGLFLAAFREAAERLKAGDRLGSAPQIGQLATWESCGRRSGEDEGVGSSDFLLHSHGTYSARSAVRCMPLFGCGVLMTPSSHISAASESALYG